MGQDLLKKVKNEGVKKEKRRYNLRNNYTQIIPVPENKLQFYTTNVSPWGYEQLVYSRQRSL